MALSGSFKTKKGGYTLRTEWSATQDIANNKSTITCTHYLDSTWALYIGGRTNKCTIDGTKYEFKSSDISKGTGSWTVKLGTSSKTVSHNADGSKSLSMSTVFYMKANITSLGYVESITANSGTITLNQIPRQANLTAAPNFNDEANPTITYSNPAGNAVTSLQAAIYNTAGSTAYAGYRDVTKTGTSYTFSLTTAERDALRAATPGSNTMDVKFYLKTVIGSNTFYSSITKTLSITNGKPTLSPNVYDTNSTTTALTGDNTKLVKYYSNAYYSIGAAAVKKASLSSQSVTHNGSTKTSATGTYNGVTTNSFVFSAKDSRGNTNSSTITRTLINYVKLTCNQEVKIDVSGNATIKINGNYFNGSFGAVANTLTVQYRWKKSGGSYTAWTNATATKSGNTYSATATVSGFAYKDLYVFQARAIDKLATIPTSEKNIKSLPVYDWGKNDFVFNVPVKFGAGFTQTTAEAMVDDDGEVYAGDYVVEQGTDGAYTYRKWNSGVMEAWRVSQSQMTITAKNTAATGAYYTDQTTFRTTNGAAQFSTLENVQVTVNKNGSTGFWQPVVARTNVEGGVASADIFFTNPVKDATAALSTYVYFIGRWR